MAIVFTEHRSKNESIIKLNPMAAITWKNRIRNFISNQIPKLTMVNSKIISHRPRVTRKLRISFTLFLFWKDKYAEVPERKTNTGAHRCVIHLVKKRMGVVVERSSGFCVMECTCIRSRIWSSAMMIITSPRAKSIEVIRFNRKFLINFLLKLVIWNGSGKDNMTNGYMSKRMVLYHGQNTY